jgi:hypothetical protein
VLTGGTPKDNRNIIGSSKLDTYVAFDNFVDAMNSVPELDIHLPQTLWSGSKRALLLL